jgi:class 3 adenylate cyclase
MNPFQKRTALRIAAISLMLAAIASPLAWFVAQENAEEGIVSLAMEASDGLLRHFDAIDLDATNSIDRAKLAAGAIAGGLFDIAEIYNSHGIKLAEGMTPEGDAIEPTLSKHGFPDYVNSSYESLTDFKGRWVLRVFVPLRVSVTDKTGPVSGYFEGIRIVPDWQRDQIYFNSLLVALMAGLASLLCGAVLYPVVVRLSSENERTARKLLDSQSALIEALQLSEHNLETKINQRTAELKTEQARTKELLYNILPKEVADELSVTGGVSSVRHDAVSILFTDFCEFTQAVSAMPADRMVAELSEIFEAFDNITDTCGVEKIKTIGDAYMAAAGLPKACPDHAHRCVRAGLMMIDYLNERNQMTAFKWSLRVGVHSGPVVAGVVGKRKYAYDVWGDTVNIASRMERTGETGHVSISAFTCDLVHQEFDCKYRGKVDAKGKGNLDMYFVIGKKEI